MQLLFSISLSPRNLARAGFRCAWTLLVLLLCCLAGQAQVGPRIGYVYPAGGQQGTTFEITIGGQNLDGTTNVFVSGEGIQAVVADFHRPMPQGQFNLLRDKLKELQDKQREYGPKDGPKSGTNAWTNADEKQLAEIRAKILKNPPNRNATPAIADTVTVKITIATNAAPGEREIRVANGNAASNPLLFCVGQLREFSKPPAKTPNPDLDRYLERLGRKPEPISKGEMRIKLPATINGQIMPGAVDRFKFMAYKGQKIVIEVSARRLIPYLADAVPGWFQATLALYDSKGRELQYADDYRYQPDPVLFYQIPFDGDYIIEVKDSIYRGREDFVYRISLGELPFVTSIFPLGAKAGSQTEVNLKGWNLDQSTVRITSAEAGLQTVSSRRGEWNGNVLPFAVDAIEETRDHEPNNSETKAQKVTLPIVINGHVDQPGDVDVFRFDGRAGDQVVVEVLARRLSSPLDSVLSVVDASGNQLAFNDDYEDRGAGLSTHHADSYLRATLPKDGRYYIRLGDTQKQGGQEFAYRLRIGAPAPEFELRVVPSTVNVRGGASVPLTVYALRKDGFTNAIDLVLEDAPEGFVLSGARIPANQEKTRLTLTAAPAASGPVRLKIAGSARVGERRLQCRAVPAEDMMQAFAYRHLVPSRELIVMVSARGMQRFPVKILGEMPVEMSNGGTTSVHLNAAAKGIAEKLFLELNEPPDGITLEKVVTTKSGAELVLRSDSSKVKPGTAGNLIVEVFANKPDAAATQRRQPIATLPAIAFQVR